MTETRYLPGITGCHECDKAFETLEMTYCKAITVDKDSWIDEYVNSETLHPDCPLAKSRVKKLEWKETNDERSTSIVAETCFDGFGIEILFKKNGRKTLFIGHKSIELNKDTTKEEAKAEAQKHYEDMINGCLI